MLVWKEYKWEISNNRVKQWSQITIQPSMEPRKPGICNKETQINNKMAHYVTTE